MFHSIAVSSSRSYNNCKREKGALLWFAQRGMQTLCAPMVVAVLLRFPSSKTACSPSSILFPFRSVNYFYIATLVLYSQILNYQLLQRLHNITQLNSCDHGPRSRFEDKAPGCWNSSASDWIWRQGSWTQLISWVMLMWKWISPSPIFLCLKYLIIVTNCLDLKVKSWHRLCCKYFKLTLLRACSVICTATSVPSHSFTGV